MHIDAQRITVSQFTGGQVCRRVTADGCTEQGDHMGSLHRCLAFHQNIAVGDQVEGAAAYQIENVIAQAAEGTGINIQRTFGRALHNAFTGRVVIHGDAIQIDHSSVSHHAQGTVPGITRSVTGAKVTGSYKAVVVQRGQSHIANGNGSACIDLNTAAAAALIEVQAAAILGGQQDVCSIRNGDCVVFLLYIIDNDILGQFHDGQIAAGIRTRQCNSQFFLGGYLHSGNVAAGSGCRHGCTGFGVTIKAPVVGLGHGAEIIGLRRQQFFKHVGVLPCAPGLAVGGDTVHNGVAIYVDIFQCGGLQGDTVQTHAVFHNADGGSGQLCTSRSAALDGGIGCLSISQCLIVFDSRLLHFTQRIIGSTGSLDGGLAVGCHTANSIDPGDGRIHSLCLGCAHIQNLQIILNHILGAVSITAQLVSIVKNKVQDQLVSVLQLAVAV